MEMQGEQAGLGTRTGQLILVPAGEAWHGYQAGLTA